MRTLPIPTMGGLLGWVCALTETQEKAMRKIENAFMFTSGIRRGTRFDLTDFFEALAQALFEALVRGLVVIPAGWVVGEALHVRDFVVVFVRVLVAFAVPDVFHQACDRVTQVQRDGIGF